MSPVKNIGRYEIVTSLAAGGMAEILLGRLNGPSGFERAVVIKRILPHLARSSTFVDMFLDEARIVAKIRHPNVVQVHELGKEEDDLFLVMEFLEGETVAALTKRAIARRRSIEPWVVAHVGAEACAGLHAAHELTDSDGELQHLVHRDVSPQNVFVTYGGATKVIDFGVAKAADRIARTETGQLKGKFDYMSPEQCRGLALDRRSDVFALGIVLYELGVQKRLFKRANAMATMRAICDDPITPPSLLAPGYSSELERILMKALARKADDRYATAADMRCDLLGVLRELGPPAPEEAVARLMGELFADRIAEKREMLRRVSSGSEITHVPGDTDTSIEIPVVFDELREATAAGMRDSGRIVARSKRRGRWLGAAAVAVALGAGTVVAVRLRPKPVSSASVPAVAPLAAAAASPAAAEPAAPEIVVHVETKPAGAHVLIGARDFGGTPVDLRLPKGLDPVELELRRPGFVLQRQKLVPDVDQRVLLALSPERVRAATSPRQTDPATPTAASTPSPSASGKGYRKFN